MFCPKCGMPGKGKRFCTRCGLQLTLVRYQGVPVTRRKLTENAAAVTERVLNVPNLATQKLAVANTPGDFTSVIRPAGVTEPLQPAVKTEAIRSHHKTALAGVVFLLVIMVSGFWWHKNQGKTLQAQTFAFALTEVKQADLSSTTTVQNQAVTENAVTLAVKTDQLPESNSAWAIVEPETLSASEVENALLADQQMAVIAPGGQLALEFRAGQFFGNGPQADLQIFGATHGAASYTVFVRNGSMGPWQRVDSYRKAFSKGVAGHDIGHHGVQRAKQVLIRNDAQGELQIDAVTVSYQDFVSANVGHAHSKPSQLRGRKASTGQPAKRKRVEGFFSAKQMGKPIVICLKKRSRDS